MINEYTIEPDSDGFAVYGHGEYEESSVLAGQYRRVFVDRFDTVEEAITEYPNAEVLQHSTKVDIPMSDVPPEGFDPLDAGEVWHENDY